MAKHMQIVTNERETSSPLLPLFADGKLLTVDALRAAVARDSALNFSMSYQDSDGDTVTIARDADLKELVDYMTDEGLEKVDVCLTPQGQAGREVASAVQTDLRGLVTVMLKLKLGNAKQPTPANAMNLLVASLQTLCVAEDTEMATVKTQLLEVLLNDEFRAVVKELSTSIEFKDLMDVMASAIYQEDAQVIEETATARLDELLVFTERVVVLCPSLKSVIVDVIKKCWSGLLRYNDDMINDDSNSSVNSELVKLQVENEVVHENIICDGCDKTPLVGIRYKSFNVDDFDLCEECEATRKWESHEPFIKITDPSRAPRPKDVVHPYVVCDGCEISPLVGIRFKSKSAEDFDLCETCEKSGKWTESHGPFMKILNPGMMNAMKCTFLRRPGKFGKRGEQLHSDPLVLSSPPHRRGHPDVDVGVPQQHGPLPECTRHRVQTRGCRRCVAERESSSNAIDADSRHRTDDFFYGHPAHGPPPPLPEFNEPWRRHGNGGYDPSFGPPSLEHPVLTGSQEFGPRGARESFGLLGRQARISVDNDEQKRTCIRRSYGNTGRRMSEASDLEVSFLEDVTIYDGTVVEPGEPLLKIWKLTNDGERSWPDGCYMISQSDNPMLPNSWKLSRIDLPLLAPGEEYQVSANLIAPKQPGCYRSFWRVCDPAGRSFGHRFWIDIIVSGDAVTGMSVTDSLTSESGGDNEVKDVHDVTSPVDVSSDDDIEIIEAAEVQEAEAEECKSAVEKEDSDKCDLKKSLELLTSMGFSDTDANLLALQLADGNIGNAVNVLLME